MCMYDVTRYNKVVNRGKNRKQFQKTRRDSGENRRIMDG